MNDERYDLDCDLIEIIPAVRAMTLGETLQLIELLEWRAQTFAPPLSLVTYDYTAEGLQ